MKAVTGKQMGLIDKYAIEQTGIPGIVLMENAALKVVKHIKSYYEQKKHCPKSVVIVAGKGNNAGDAFAVARHLFLEGYKVKVYCLFPKESIAGDAGINLDILERIGADIKLISIDCDLDGFISEVKYSQIVLDGIFGTGFRGEIEGITAQIINIINQYSQYTLSIDIASGVESFSGRTSDIYVQAHKTVTFELPKIGQLIYPGVQATGELAVESIGMPVQAINSQDINTFLSDIDLIKSFIPKRVDESNKGDYGKVTIVTGSTGMAGSGCLTAKAALRSGSGLVYLVVPSDIIPVYQNVVPEAVSIYLRDSIGAISAKSIDTIANQINKCDVAAIGPGLSQDPEIYDTINAIAEKINVPVILDADALNAAAKNTDIFKKFKADVVITPHPGEMGRLTGLDISYIQKNRIEVAVKYAALWGVIVVLKGARTIIADKNGTVFINPTGNSGMATAGSGDSLTGIITSLIGQGASSLEAAAAAVYIHGMAGDLAAKIKGEYGMTAADIVENIPAAICNIIY